MKIIKIITMFGLLIFNLTSYSLAFANDKFSGSCIGDEILQNFDDYFNQVTPENAGKWGSVEKARNIYDWQTLDNIYNYTKSNNYLYKHHTLIWGQQQPEWLNSLKANEQKKEIEEWIQLVCSRYPLVDMIDVVNEPINHPPLYKDAIGGSGTCGYDWIIWSFEKARQYCPNADLIINEYNILNNSSNLKELINIVKILKSKSLIDGIGIQGHYFEIQNMSADEINKSLDELSLTGLSIYISELEIDESDDAKQLDEYQRVFPVLWEHPSVYGITLWGYIQGKIWKENGYLIRSDGSERPAFKWLIDYIY